MLRAFESLLSKPIALILYVMRIVADNISQTMVEEHPYLWGHPDLGVPAAAATACMLDLLHMRVLKYSPMTVSDPYVFVKCCQGDARQ